MVSEYKKVIMKADSVMQDLGQFHIQFYDEKKFGEEFASFKTMAESYDEICLSGYFSEGGSRLIRESLNTNVKIRVLSPQFREIKGKLSLRDESTLDALRMMDDEENIEVRIHSKLHCRMLIGHRKAYRTLILGSFDFNKEGAGDERRDAGIYTHHPDLVQSALEYYDKIWKEKRYSKALKIRYPE